MLHWSSWGSSENRWNMQPLSVFYIYIFHQIWYIIQVKLFYSFSVLPFAVLMGCVGDKCQSSWITFFFYLCACGGWVIAQLNHQGGLRGGLFKCYSHMSQQPSSLRDAVRLAPASHMSFIDWRRLLPRVSEISPNPRDWCVFTWQAATTKINSSKAASCLRKSDVISARPPSFQSCQLPLIDGQRN